MPRRRRPTLQARQRCFGDTKGVSSLRAVRLRLGKSGAGVGQRRRAVPTLGSMGGWRARSPVRLQRKWCINTSLKIGRDAAPPASHTSGAPAPFRGCKEGVISFKHPRRSQPSIGRIPLPCDWWQRQLLRASNRERTRFFRRRGECGRVHSAVRDEEQELGRDNPSRP